MKKKIIIILALSVCLVISGVVLALTLRHTHSFDVEYSSNEQYHYHSCKCGQVTAKEEHKFVIDEYKAPTCIADGCTQGKHCRVCGYVAVEQQVIPKNAQLHNIKHFEYKAPTCTEDGHNEYDTCLNGCGYSTYQKIEKIGHKYLTCEHLDGTKSHISVCENNSEHFEIEDCDFENLSVVDPTCEEQGYTIRKCKKCGYVCKDFYVSAYGHTIQYFDRLNYVAPTCENNGSYDLNVTCKDCGIALGTEHVTENALGHLWGEWEHLEETETHQRTCQRDSAHTQTANCNKVFVLDGISYIKYSCTECGQEYYEYVSGGIPFVLPSTCQSEVENKRKIK